MKVTSFGHSSFLLEMLSPEGEPVRILGDPWLSDYVIGDLVGRFPRVRLKHQQLPPIDALYFTHSHTDHFDPYSILDLWQNLPQRPMILLPQSIQYLVPLLEEFLPGVSITVLEDNLPIDVNGINVTALLNPERRPTNEDDVMILVVENDTEVFVCESDALLPFYDPEAREAISAYLGEGSAETAVFLTTKNELAASMASLSAKSVEDRIAFVAGSEDRTLQEVTEIFTPMPDHESDLWMNSTLVRLVGGQGICFPQEVDPQWNRVLFPIRIADRVAMEREVVAQNEMAVQIEEFLPGVTHILENGQLVDRQPCRFIELLDREEDREFDGEIALFENFPEAPLREDVRNHDEQERRILDLLNQRFLPYLIGMREPPVQHLLSGNGGQYVVRVRYGVTEDFSERDYGISFADLKFSAQPLSGDPDEAYWANDLDDYFAGKADDFSTFCRTAIPATTRRFWDALGMPYLNNDLVERKQRLHFQRARDGQSLADYVLPFYEFYNSTENEDYPVDAEEL
ncbi:MAG: MBL fold metallo-hydrolase [Planctomycetota bacterium]